MHCFFVSKDYLLAVSSTAVDRHGQPFRDSMKNPPKSAERPARGSRKRQLEPGPQVTETHDKQDTKQDKGTKQPFLPLSWWCLLWVLPRGGPPGQGLCEHPKSKNTHFQISIFTFFAKAWKNNKCHATFVGSTYQSSTKVWNFFAWNVWNPAPPVQWWGKATGGAHHWSGGAGYHHWTGGAGDRKKLENHEVKKVAYFCPAWTEIDEKVATCFWKS